MAVSHILKLEAAGLRSGKILRSVIREESKGSLLLMENGLRTSVEFTKTCAGVKEIGIKAHFLGDHPHEQYKPFLMRSDDLPFLVKATAVSEIINSDIERPFGFKEILPSAIDYINSRILTHRVPEPIVFSDDQISGLQALDHFLARILLSNDKLSRYFENAGTQENSISFSNDLFYLSMRKTINNNDFGLMVQFGKFQHNDPLTKSELNVINKYSLLFNFKIEPAGPELIYGPISFTSFATDYTTCFIIFNPETLELINCSFSDTIPQHVVSLDIKDVSFKAPFIAGCGQ